MDEEWGSNQTHSLHRTSDVGGRIDIINVNRIAVGLRTVFQIIPEAVNLAANVSTRTHAKY